MGKWSEGRRDRKIARLVDAIKDARYELWFLGPAMYPSELKRSKKRVEVLELKLRELRGDA